LWRWTSGHGTEAKGRANFAAWAGPCSHFLPASLPAAPSVATWLPAHLYPSAPALPAASLGFDPGGPRPASEQNSMRRLDRSGLPQTTACPGGPAHRARNPKGLREEGQFGASRASELRCASRPTHARTERANCWKACASVVTLLPAAWRSSSTTTISQFGISLSGIPDCVGGEVGLWAKARTAANDSAGRTATAPSHAGASGEKVGAPSILRVQI
jgi:hypothetical protein